MPMCLQQHLTEQDLVVVGNCIFRSNSLQGGGTLHSLQVPKQSDPSRRKLYLRPNTTELSQQLQETATYIP